MNKTTLSILLLSTLSLPLANANNDILMVKLDTMVVSGSRTEKILLDVPVSISVITQEDIQRNGAEQVGELLRDIPGVTITDTSVAGAKRVRIRGEVGSNVLILIDGQEISEQRSSHGAAPLLVDPNIIERIEVVKGPASVLYGSKAIGGVVNIFTKKGGDRAIQAELNASYNSSTDGFDTNAQLYGSVNNFDYRLSVSRADHGDRKVPDGTDDNIAYNNKDGVLENSSFDNSNVNAYLAYNMDKITIGARLESYKADTESHTDNSIIENGLEGFQLDLPKRDRKKASIFFEANDVTESLVKMRLDAFHQVRDRDFSQDLLVNVPNFAGPGSNIAIDLDLKTVFKQKNSGLQAQFDLVFHPDHYIVSGFDYSYDKMKSNVMTVSKTTFTGVPFPSPPLSVTDTTVESHQETKAIYLQDEWSLNDDMTITAGIRQTWVDTELDKENSSVLNKIDTNESRAVGSLAFVYSGIENTAIRAGWSQGFRVPALLELLEGTPHGGSGILHANSDLDPETSNSYEIGLRFDKQQFTFDGAVFYTEAKDYIATVSCSSSTASCPTPFAGSDTQYTNVNGANTFGIELFSAYQFTDSIFSIYSNLTYLRREFEFTEFSTYQTGHPNFEGRIGLEMATTYNNIDYWSDLYMRGAIDADNESPDSSAPSGKDTEHYDGWATLNLSMGADINIKTPLNISLHLNNLFDKTYTPSQESLISPGRHFVVKAGIKF
ncbi:MAG: TonB-dependent receptor [Methylococcales symbiont of Hymedesmia sp. n. MRB-2018]|nr:MAG: TonB-dependent receptor [Methylococcales symbiont of Hymedesmia sp. n. MRB-2018]